MKIPKSKKLTNFQSKKIHNRCHSKSIMKLLLCMPLNIRLTAWMAPILNFSVLTVEMTTVSWVEEDVNRPPVASLNSTHATAVTNFVSIVFINRTGYASSFHNSPIERLTILT
ncbi:PREDICTED: uncharacterized protein LOC107170766 [Diuraphis noxia]|uniref:uncharacterized protein LOC107170766 n=1 Tax=Diuraphis noxia TaxID=143948 RepID=UPI0007638EEE|nr:PREDICTED: uncharacterized protein LOC107170766 [Diuraphis noxia]